MLFMVVGELKDREPAQISQGGKVYGDLGPAEGTTQLWLSADGTTSFTMIEAEDINAVHRACFALSPWFDFAVHAVASYDESLQNGMDEGQTIWAAYP